MFSDNQPLPPIESDQTDLDFAVYIGTRHVADTSILKLIERRRDPRVLLWTPAELTQEERDRLMDFAAYRKLISDWQGKETEDAVAVVNWVSNALQSDLAKIVKIVDNSYPGRVDALNNTQMEFRWRRTAAFLTPCGRVLTAAYFPGHKLIRLRIPHGRGGKGHQRHCKAGRMPKGQSPSNIRAARTSASFEIRKKARKGVDVRATPMFRDVTFIDDS
jgi:hypothetical protein